MYVCLEFYVIHLYMKYRIVSRKCRTIFCLNLFEKSPENKKLSADYICMCLYVPYIFIFSRDIKL